MKMTDTQVGGDHYTKMGIQPIDFILSNNIGFCEANAIKYLCRHKDKGGKQDLEKAIHYIKLLIEHEYPTNFDPAKVTIYPTDFWDVMPFGNDPKPYQAYRKTSDAGAYDYV